MIRSHSDTTTTATTFSSDSPSLSSAPSEPTSDETPDLGQFTAVLRAWTDFQPPPRIVAQQAYTLSSSRSLANTTTSSSDLHEDKSTVWSHRPIANYLALSDTVSVPTDTDSTDRPRTVQIDDGDDEVSAEYDIYDDHDTRDESDERMQFGIRELTLQDVEDLEQPSLGYLDEALQFIAAERERWTAQREAGTTAAMLAGIEPRRKRRRKRNKTPRAQSTTRTPTVSSFSSSVSTVMADLDDVDALAADADDSSSSIDQQHSSPLGAPRSNLFNRASRRTRGRQAKLQHSRSTPQLRILHRDEDEDEEDDSQSTDPVVEDSPRVQQLKLLGKKLADLFPEDREYLQKVRYNIMSVPATTGPQLHSFGSAGYFDSSADTDRESSRNVGLGGFVDTRGVPPKKTTKDDERLIHVFVDHSNILIGLLNYLRQHPRQHPQYRDSYFNGPQSFTTSTATFTPTTASTSTSPPYPKPPKHLSHSALSLILERGRPVTRRVLVTSSPLYQPMESAERLGFEVRVFARVPDTGDGMDRERDREKNPNGYGNGSGKHNHHRSQSSGSSIGATGNVGSPSADSALSPKRQRKRAGSMNNNNSYSNNSYNHNNRKNHSRKMSDNTNTSTESEQNGSGAGGVFPRGFLQGQNIYSHSLPTSHTSTPPLALAPSVVITPSSAGLTPAPQPRIRYREQGVDELLQLKLHQVLASIDGPPPKDSTIILATGDGNVGQFNEDGFLGGVRTALKRGWKVELYAWEGGLSRAWRREFGEGSEWARGEGASFNSSPGKTGRKGKNVNGKSKGMDEEGGPRFKVIGMEQFGSELVEIYF